MEKNKHIMILDMQTAKDCGLKNYFSAKDLLLDIKALAKEYYTMTFTVDSENPEAVISFNNLQVFKLTITELT